MRVNIREIVLTAAVVLWPIAAIGQESIAIKSFTVFMGQCRLQIIVGFFPCDGRVIYTELKNGRSMVTFTKANAIFTVSGGTDRQPDLEDYYVGIDTIRLHQENGEEAEDHGMGGECHFRMN